MKTLITWSMKSAGVFLAAAFITIFFPPITSLIAGQISTPTPWFSKPTDQDWWMRKLWMAGFPDFLQHDTLPAMRASLSLTDEQMKAVAELDRLYVRHRQIESHTFEVGKKNPLDERCIEGAIRLRTILGDEKFDDLCQWSWEDLVIHKALSKLRLKHEDFKDEDRLSNQIAKEIKGAEGFNDYKKRKTLSLGSNAAASRYFSNHSGKLKLRILHKLYGYQYPVLGERFKQDERKRIAEKQKSVLGEVNNSGSY